MRHCSGISQQDRLHVKPGEGGGISWNNRLALVQHSYPHDIIDYSFNYASFWKGTLMSFSVTNSAIQRRNGADKLGVTEQHETE